LNKVKVWRCKGGHVLVIVVRNGSGVRQLLLYREAVDSQLQPLSQEVKEELKEVDVIAVVDGRVMDVRCSICRRVRSWVPLDL